MPDFIKPVIQASMLDILGGLKEAFAEQVVNLAASVAAGLRNGAGTANYRYLRCYRGIC